MLTPEQLAQLTPEQRTNLRHQRLENRILQILVAVGVPPYTGGKTIGEVNRVIASETDYNLLEVVAAFQTLYHRDKIYPIEDSEEIPMRWRIIQ